jgi:hypothetical protein
MTAFALTSIVVAYRIALHRFGFVWPLLAVAAAEIVGIGYHHDGIVQILQVLVTAQVAALAACLIPGRATTAREAVLEPAA